MSNPTRNPVKEPQALIVEDDTDLALIFAEALAAAHFQTEIVSDGDHAMPRILAVCPDLVVLDLHLPHVSGLNIARQIRARKELTDTRILIATADPNAADMLAQEVDLVLIKPISFVQLRDMAARLRPKDMWD